MAKRLDLKPKRLNLILALLGALAFVALGAWIALAQDAGVIERAAGLIGVAFFGYVGFFIVRAFFQARGISVTPIALYWRGPTFSEKRIPWSEIAWADVIEQNGQKFNRIALKGAAPLIARFSPEEARATCAAMGAMIRFARVATPIAALSGGGSGAESAAAIARKGRAETLEELFGFLRAQYGGEILLGWADRDRSAAQLDALLQSYLASGR